MKNLPHHSSIIHSTGLDRAVQEMGLKLVDKICEEVKPVLEGFQAACSEHNTTISKEVEKKVAELLRLTKEACRQAEEATGRDRH